MRIAPLLLAFAIGVPALSKTLFAQTLGCVSGGSGGPTPTSGTGGGGTFPTSLPPHPGIYALNVPALPPGASVVSEVKLLGFAHTFVGDLQFVLGSPAGVSYNLVVRRGESCDVAGDYVLVPGCSTTPVNSWNCSGLLAPGAYEQSFGLWNDGAIGIYNASLFSIPAQTGVWTLTLYDWTPGDVGALTSWELCFGAAPMPSSHPPSGAPTLTEPPDGGPVLGPTVALGWYADACATSYEIEIDGVIVGSASTAGFEHTSTQGAHDWRVRSLNSAGAGPWSAAHSFTDAGVPPQSCSGPQLTTLFAKNNNVPSGGILYFDVDVLTPAGVLISEIDTNSLAAVGVPLTLDVYVKSGTYVGATFNPSAWTLVSTGVGSAAGIDRPTLIDVADFQLAPGSYGFGLVLTGGPHAHSSGVSAPQFFNNSELALSAGQAQLAPFVTATFSLRVWNGALRYDCAPPVVTYCTAGSTTNGCSASISVDQQPSASLASVSQVTVSGVEGQKQGLMFYGVDNSGYTPLPWGFGSTSYACVQGPILRAVAMNSGGAAGQCDGTLTFDWNAFQSTHPGALGSPFAAGDKVYVQGWFRDPPAPRASSLSNAIELTLVP